MIDLHQRAREARGHYISCDLCGHDCRVDRTHGPNGVCREDDGLWLAGAGVHFGEEPALVPCGLILIGGCNLRCESCETFELSIERRGLVRTSPQQLAALMLDLQKRGAANANFVTPTHVLPALLEGIALAREHGCTLPIVWNCGGYESLPALKLLDGIVDIYLPDAKYGDDEKAFELSGCKRYVETTLECIAEMHRQTRTIVRHLILPNGQASPEKLMPRLAKVSETLQVNLLTQYRPVFRAAKLPLVSRTVNEEDVRQTIVAARNAGLRNLLLDGRPLR